MPQHRGRGLIFSLAQRERAGVRENGHAGKTHSLLPDYSSSWYESSQKVNPVELAELCVPLRLP
jgi:hypothetical protein